MTNLRLGLYQFTIPSSCASSPLVAYSGRLSKEKFFFEFRGFVVIHESFLSVKFRAWCPLAQDKQAIHESFLAKITFLPK